MDRPKRLTGAERVERQFQVEEYLARHEREFFVCPKTGARLRVEHCISRQVDPKENKTVSESMRRVRPPTLSEAYCQSGECTEGRRRKGALIQSQIQRVRSGAKVAKVDK